MPLTPGAVSRGIFTATFLLYAAVAVAEERDKPAPSPSPEPLHTYQALVPLGSENFRYSNKTEHALFYVMASAYNEQFEGEQVWLSGEKRVLRAPDGSLVENYPSEVRFRVSVSGREGFEMADTPMLVESKADSFDSLISTLRFDLRISHALECRKLQPWSVTQIGVPADLPSNERVYEVVFDLGSVPVSDRVVMDVVTAQGERLAKFNLDLY